MAMRLRLIPRDLTKLILLLGLTTLTGCRSDSPEAALRGELQAMSAAVEEGKTADFMESVADDFAGNQGMDRAALHNLLRINTLRRSRIGITTGPVEIDLQESHATVRFTAVMTGSGSGYLPDSAQSYSITSGWRNEGGTWRVYYAEWKPML